MDRTLWQRLAVGAAVAAAIAVVAAALVAFNTPTVVLIVRHAERAAAPADNPPLTPAGVERAETLAHVGANAGVSGIFATEFLRTQQTVEPLATQTGVTVTEVPADNVDDLVAQIRGRRGATLLVAGHTHTIPEIIQKLGAGTIGPIVDTEFDNLFVVTIPRLSSIRLVKLQYGNPT
jgi:broad specificity phosphatase PhoE